MPAVIKNTVAMEDAVYITKMDDNSAPLITEYKINIIVAVVNDRRFIAALTPITKANSAIISPHISMELL